MSVNKEIFRIAIPNIIANISIPLLGIVDTALMGRMEDTAFIGAIALGGIIFNIIYWGFGFLRPGTTGLTAQAFGKKEMGETYRLFFRSSIIGFFIGLVILAFHQPIGQLFFHLLSGSEEVEGLAYRYFSIRVLGAPAVICMFAFRGWFFGIQDAITPMVLTIITNVLNIFLSWYLVMVKGFSVEGVAYGTLAAQWITFVIAILYVLYKHQAALRPHFNKMILKTTEMTRFFSVNRDMFIRNVGLIFVFTYYTNHSSKVGDDYLAINQILIQLFYFMSYAVDGFAYASESLVGKYLGAKAMDKINEVINKCLIFGLGFGCSFAVVYLIWGEQILFLFTDNKGLISEGSQYLFWLALVAVSGSLAFIWDGIYSGGTASVEMRDSMILAVILFIIVFFVVDRFDPYISIWAAMVAFMLARSVFQILLYYTKIRFRWKEETTRL